MISPIVSTSSAAAMVGRPFCRPTTQEHGPTSVIPGTGTRKGSRLGTALTPPSSRFYPQRTEPRSASLLDHLTRRINPRDMPC